MKCIAWKFNYACAVYKTMKDTCCLSVHSILLCLRSRLHTHIIPIFVEIQVVKISKEVSSSLGCAFDRTVFPAIFHLLHQQ